jgi:periplasmic divalent cation tolerance protein
MSDKTKPERAVGMIYVTCGSVNEAREIGDAVVRERLAACANIIEGMRSIYWWQGAVEEGAETVLILKTAVANVPSLSERVKALHSYDVPCIAEIPLGGGNADYLDWIVTESGVHWN